MDATAGTFAELSAGIDLEAARRAIGDRAVRTPAIASPELAEMAGGPVLLKAESLQVSGSFKLRGALAKLAALGPLAEHGLIAASAGNHARAVAQAARLAGVGCQVFMPRDAPVSKVAAVERLGAGVRLSGASVEDALELARAAAQDSGAALIHPFDDPDVIAGQGTLGLELVEQVPDLARVIVPVGGGGLACGIGLALLRERPGVELIGVQASACAPLPALLAGTEVAEVEAPAAATIADGIALKRPGALTLPLLRRLLGSVQTVAEEQIADAMVLLAERAKLVAEGAGAVAVAALMRRELPPVAGTTVAIVSGGNVDAGLLASLLRRQETAAGRRVRLLTRVPDRPGGLAELLRLVAEARANLLTLEHLREAVALGVRETAVELTLETRGPEHTEQLGEALRAAGYEVSFE
ncbi:MAG TPA: pyridoxal-phosphate dependent enzyme [Solirubrobacteraceae bacterium]|nr:pyridoxal-phosphate dependent enzyme [Solirubrobacteraceae bacterium]